MEADVWERLAWYWGSWLALSGLAWTLCERAENVATDEARRACANWIHSRDVAAASVEKILRLLTGTVVRVVEHDEVRPGRLLVTILVSVAFVGGTLTIHWNKHFEGFLYSLTALVVPIPVDLLLVMLVRQCTFAWARGRAWMLVLGVVAAVLVAGRPLWPLYPREEFGGEFWLRFRLVIVPAFVLSFISMILFVDVCANRLQTFAQAIDRRFLRMRTWIDTENKPFLSIGLLWLAALAVGYLLGLPILLFQS